VRTYLTAAETAAITRRSLRSIHELTRTAAIPHRRPAGTQRCLFDADEITAWLDGAELEVLETPAGGRVVRPVSVVPRAA